jgi:23S rRNA (cytosine1962-C5)-methyltransferase
MVAAITLKAGRVQPIWAGHPWVYTQAIAETSGNLEPGGEVDVRDARGQFMGRGLYSKGSAIAVRLFTRTERAIDTALIRERLERALALRGELGLPNNETTAYRWVHGEGDGLPGLIVDVFGKCVSVQFGTLGLWLRKELILRQIDALLGPEAIFDRTPARIAKLEGFNLGEPVVKGSPRPLEFAEHGVRYAIPFELQQKTGYYCDQRPLREYVRSVSHSKRVLDAYGYVGSIGLNAARGGARQVVSVDKSDGAYQTATQLAVLNGFEGTLQAEKADVLEFFARTPNSAFDLVICDPPKLAQNRKAKEGAGKFLRALAKEACRTATVGGQVVLCSCSAAVGVADLSRALALGALDAGRHLRITHRLFQGPDHPVAAGFAEGEYLSTLVAHVTRRD